MVFQPPFGQNNEYGGGGDFKGGVPSLIGVGRGCSAHAIWGFSDPAHAIWWVAETSPLLKPEIVGVAGANMQWGHFVCPSCSQKRRALHLN